MVPVASERTFVQARVGTRIADAGPNERTPVTTLANAFGFFHWVGISHYVNLLFVGFLIRSGLQILSAHPKLYWNDACRPDSTWLKFTRKQMPADRLWTASDEEDPFSSWVALPGGRNLGVGRHWHFFCALFWMLNGFVYVALLVATGEWRRLLPASWSSFPEAAHTGWIYLHLRLPPAGHPYNPLQQLAYAGVVFGLGPLLIATGAAMSPAVAARFPWYVRAFGGRQSARSLHFLGLLAMSAFVVVHVALVVIDDFPRNMAWIVHGEDKLATLSIAIGMAGLGVIVALHVWATRFSLRHPEQVQRVLGAATRPVQQILLHHVTSRQRYSMADVGYFRVNGYPPTGAEYEQLARSNFVDWRLEIYGLVKTPMALSLADLRSLPTHTQITLHHCIQGWSGVAAWTGVSLAELLARCEPLPGARYLVLRAFDEHVEGQPYFETIDLELARHAQTILAFDMNGETLPIPHGAPCRVRVETQLGFKMVKYLRSIELIADYRTVGRGQGGFREDTQFYGPEAGI
jgi:sulfoxide reductase catalytic subunit YedY